VGVDLTAVGVGSVQLIGDANAANTGKYSVDNSDKWNSVPVWQTVVKFPAPAP
jgi:hypothetical protein